MRSKKKSPLKAYLALLVRAIVLERDGYKCRRCGATDRILDCSHIKSQGAHPHMRYTVENCKVLCKGCHRFFWHGPDPDKPMAWYREAFPQSLRDKLDMMAGQTRPAKTDLAGVRLYLEAEAARLGCPLPPAPKVA